MAQQRCTKYEEWIEPVNKIVPELKRRIHESDTGNVNMSIKELANMMGPEYENISTAHLREGLLCRLFNEGIWLGKSNIFSLKNTKENDKLSPFFTTE